LEQLMATRRSIAVDVPERFVPSCRNRTKDRVNQKKELGLADPARPSP
jgi:hypothetical protein